jgi:hypothetical protein
MGKRVQAFILLLIGFTTLSAWATDVPDSAAFTVFLIGNAGDGTSQEHQANLRLLRSQLLAAGKRSAVVFLGDNVHPRGLPDEGSPGRKEAEQSLLSQLEVLKDYDGQVFFIPGNHDWNKGGTQGWKTLKNQEAFIEAYLNRGNVFLPDGGCPGPVEISLTDQITLVMLDTQWALHPWEKPGAESDCEAKDPSAVLVQLDDILNRNRHKHLLVAGHHPVYTYGRHGGYSTFKQHLFPLTDLHPGFYLPLPLVGSLYPLYRKLLGSSQDVAHPSYRLLRRSLGSVLEQYPGLVFASGHERSLQHIEKDSLHWIVSGAGAQHTPVRKGKDSRFAAARAGFARLDYGPGREVRLTYWSPTDGEPNQALYAAQWESPLQAAPGSDPALPLPTYADSSIVVRASDQYAATGFQTWLLGSNYRAEWQQAIRVPLLDLATEKGGLTPVKRGGGFQTKSLRLTAPDGREYVLRSIEKDAAMAVPEALRRTLAASLVQDQISASHPYAALTIPTLAQAAGVAHARPKVVWIPDDAHLGTFRKDFAGTLALLEEREADPPAHFTGKSNGKSYSTDKVLEKLQEDHDHRVDEQEVLRARLLDLVLADWDRHDDQWRWLAYPQSGGLLFRALPRDRDQAYFVNQGLLPRLASREWALPKVQGFDTDFRNVNSFMFNGRYFDRSFLTQLSLDQWLAMADTIQHHLSDSIIEQAVHTWPDSIFRWSGPAVIAKLKAHRDRLPTYARQYYLFLAREVAVVGSHKREYFEVIRQDDAHTLVRVSKLHKDHRTRGAVLYERLFKHRETREVVLYGLGGDDVFELRGEVKKGIRIRIVGGEGTDQIIDSSRVSGPSRKTLFYDTSTGQVLSLGTETRDVTSRDAEVNTYDRKAFQYPYLGPLIPFNYNVDDGLFLGAGLLIQRPGFRRQPYAASHRITGNVAFQTGAYNFTYEGVLVRALGKFDLQFQADVQAPNFIRNFYGLGNESVLDASSSESFYWVRYRNIALSGLLVRRLSTWQQFYFGPLYQQVQVVNSPDRLIGQIQDERLNLPTLFREKPYLGVKLGYLLDSRDSRWLPTRGVRWLTEWQTWQGLGPNTRNLNRLSSELSLYWGFRLPARVILATRLGGEITGGSFEFFQAATLGGLTNLRGYRRTRFAGNSSAYNNTELRIRLGGFHTYLFPASFGVLGFHDVGRVWLKGEASGVWHTAYGGGLWLAPFQQLVISATWGISREEQLPLIQVGFFF